MTTQTILPVNAETLKAQAVSKQEPAWVTESRLASLELAGQLELPKLEKQRIENWNIHSFGQNKQSAPLASLEELPAEAAKLVEGSRGRSRNSAQFRRCLF